MLNARVIDLLILLHCCKLGRAMTLAFYRHFCANSLKAHPQFNALHKSTSLAIFRSYQADKGSVPPLIGAIQKSLASIDAQAVSYLDSDYPPALLAVDDFPPVIFVKGMRQMLAKPMISIVGSRNASPQGVKVAHRLAGELVDNGIGVCSGLALGVDSAAHSGALSRGGFTCAVMGTGLDCIYPKRNAALARELLVNGCWVSEHLPGTPPKGTNFPARNRIVSGLSLGVIVVEARRRSGSLITARLANEQGREVFAVPGNIDFEGSQGCHDLIQQGAKLIQGVEDVLQEFDYLPKTRTIHSAAGVSCSPLERTHRRLIDLLSNGAVSLEVLAEELNYEESKLIAVLCELEVEGLVRKSGSSYIKIP